MKIDIGTSDYHQFFVFNKDTNQMLENVVSADDTTGEYEMLKKDEGGRFVIDKELGGVVREKKKGNIQIIFKDF